MGDLGFNDEDNFSRNSASSRAIPFNKMLQMVMDESIYTYSLAKGS
jgi:hypothetical protein